LQPSKPVYPGAFLPVGEPLSETELTAALRAQQINQVIAEIKAPTTVEKIDQHFKHGRFARLLARLNT